MSQHPSLRSATKNKQHRSVLKRFERIKTLSEKEEWTSEDAIFGLPKVKTLKLKSSKIKEVKTPEELAATEAAATATTEKEAAAKTEGTDKPKEK